MPPHELVQIVARVQRALEAMADVRTGFDVRDFLRLGGDPVPEVLWCRHAPDGGTELRLQLSLAVVTKLAAHDPFVRLGAHNLQELAVVCEGVSHFVHVARAHQAGWPVSALELEWQAEIDKFCLALCLLHVQRNNSQAAHRAVFAALFVHHQWQGAIARAERERYEVANRAAARLCGAWLRDGIDRDVRRLLAHARRACRLGRADKLRTA